jgi:hypothetical protein
MRRRLSMESKPVAIDLGSLILVASMVVFLTLAIVGESIALVFNGQPIGNMAASAADVSAWLFAALFFFAFAATLVRERSRDSN